MQGAEISFIRERPSRRQRTADNQGSPRVGGPMSAPCQRRASGPGHGEVTTSRQAPVPEGDAR
jgi:hypothetical protein